MRKATAFSTLILMLVLMGIIGCQTTVSTTSSRNQEPVEVVSVSMVGTPGPGGEINPGGAHTIEITLKNVGEEPVSFLRATLELKNAWTNPDLVFVNITPWNPQNPLNKLLLPGESRSETQNMIGPSGIDNGVSYPLKINVTLQSGATFVYTKQVQFK